MHGTGPKKNHWFAELMFAARTRDRVRKPGVRGINLSHVIRLPVRRWAACFAFAAMRRHAYSRVNKLQIDGGTTLAD